MANNLCSYAEFRDNVRQAMSAETIKIKDENGESIDELTELDLAIQYVLCHYWTMGQHEFTEEMLYRDIEKYCGRDVWEKCFKE